MSVSPVICYDERIFFSISPVADRNGDYFNLGVHAGRSGYYGLYKVPASSMDQEDPMEDLKLYAKIPYDNPLKPSYYHR